MGQQGVLHHGDNNRGPGQGRWILVTQCVWCACVVGKVSVKLTVITTNAGAGRDVGCAHWRSVQVGFDPRLYKGTWRRLWVHVHSLQWCLQAATWSSSSTAASPSPLPGVLSSLPTLTPAHVLHTRSFYCTHF